MWTIRNKNLNKLSQFAHPEIYQNIRLANGAVKLPKLRVSTKCKLLTCIQSVRCLRIVVFIIFFRKSIVKHTEIKGKHIHAMNLTKREWSSSFSLDLMWTIRNKNLNKLSQFAHPEIYQNIRLANGAVKLPKLRVSTKCKLLTCIQSVRCLRIVVFIIFFRKSIVKHTEIKGKHIHAMNLTKREWSSSFSLDLTERRYPILV